MGLEELTNTAGELLNAVSDFPNMRMSSGVSNRNKQIMSWRLPNGTFVQMYINPENLQINEDKQINSVRTKGGFVIQYWGDNLTKITLSGTTGSSGVKGINILRDIYHSENRAFEIIAGSQANQVLDALQTGSFKDQEIGEQLVPFVAQTLRERNFILRPSLGSLSVGVILFYQGIQYKGFFNSFNVVENIEKLGLFTYTMQFTATEIRGRRENFMAWHREPMADDPSGQLLNSIISKAGNAARGLFGLAAQQTTPMEFHPENAPLTFGGNSFASSFGLEATGPLALASRK